MYFKKCPDSLKYLNAQRRYSKLCDFCKTTNMIPILGAFYKDEEYVNMLLMRRTHSLQVIFIMRSISVLVSAHNIWLRAIKASAWMMQFRLLMFLVNLPYYLKTTPNLSVRCFATIRSEQIALIAQMDSIPETMHRQFFS